MSAQEPRLPGLVPAQAPAVPPRKLSVPIQVDRELAALDALDAATLTARLVRQVNARQDAAVARAVVQSLQDKAHRGVLVTLEDDGSTTVELCGQVPPRTITTMRRQARLQWAVNGYPT